MRFLFPIIAPVLMAGISLAQDQSHLPKETQEIVDRLADWEFIQIAELNKKLSGKRTEIVKLLVAQEVAQTKKGNIDAALALREKIKEVDAETLQILISKNQKLADLLCSKEWDFEGAIAKFLKFSPDGKAEDGLHPDLRWHLHESNHLVVWSLKDFEAASFRYDSETESFVGLTFGRKKAKLK